MENKRSEERRIYNANGYFCQDGDLLDIMITDAAYSGVGVYTSSEIKAGQQGMLVAKLPSGEKIEETPSEVCWCLFDPMADDKGYPFRAGLRLLR